MEGFSVTSGDEIESEVVRAAEDGGVIGFNPALDALYIKRHDNSQCIAWHRRGEDKMVNRNTSYRGTGSWGESNVFTADRAREFVEAAEEIETIDKRPFNFIRGHFERKNGLGVGTAWAVVFYFQDADRIVNARERTLKSVPGIGDRKASMIRGAIAHLEPPSEWSK